MTRPHRCPAEPSRWHAAFCTSARRAAQSTGSCSLCGRNFAGSILKPRGNHEAGASRAFSWVPVGRPAFGLAGADDVIFALGGEVADGDVDEQAATSSASAATVIGREKRMWSPAVL